ncbi:MAG TPA: hypothetical protein VM934_06460, partial [Pyrinomonadaceae bacterium]|nr:hypothetical protein [Pyrinomonadaceae bacterium]
MRQIFFTLIFCGSVALAACSSGGERAQSGGTNYGASNSGTLNANGGGARQTGSNAGASTTVEPGKPTGAGGESSDSVVRASAGEVVLSAGGSTSAVVQLDIAEGYHVNANPPSNKFLIGTQLDVSPGEGVTPGKPVYPASVNRKFSFDPKPLAVYEGSAAIKLPLRA